VALSAGVIVSLGLLMLPMSGVGPSLNRNLIGFGGPGISALATPHGGGSAAGVSAPQSGGVAGAVPGVFAFGPANLTFLGPPFVPTFAPNVGKSPKTTKKPAPKCRGGRLTKRGRCVKPGPFHGPCKPLPHHHGPCGTGPRGGDGPPPQVGHSDGSGSAHGAGHGLEQAHGSHPLTHHGPAHHGSAHHGSGIGSKIMGQARATLPGHP
jgi:hypothetical protein